MLGVEAVVDVSRLCVLVSGSLVPHRAPQV